MLATDSENQTCNKRVGENERVGEKHMLKRDGNMNQDCARRGRAIKECQLAHGVGAKKDVWMISSSIGRIPRLSVHQRLHHSLLK